MPDQKLEFFYFVINSDGYAVVTVNRRRLQFAITSFEKLRGSDYRKFVRDKFPEELKVSKVYAQILVDHGTKKVVTVWNNQGPPLDERKEFIKTELEKIMKNCGVDISKWKYRHNILSIHRQLGCTGT